MKAGIKKINWDKLLNGSVWILVDPDKYHSGIVEVAKECGVGAILVGGSRISGKGTLKKVIQDVRRRTRLPVILFPSGAKDVCPADGILFTSLISGKKIRYIIGEQAKAAGKIKKLKIPHISVAYLLLGKGRTTVSKVSKTPPLPFGSSKKIIGLCLAAYYLGFKAIYLEAGSGAPRPVPENLIRRICRHVPLPVLVGGGIRKISKINSCFKAGAKVVIMGNYLEKNPGFIFELKKLKK